MSPTLSVRRKSDNESIPKRDVTIADDSLALFSLSSLSSSKLCYKILTPWTFPKNRKKTVVVSLWNELATDVGERLMDMSNEAPVVAISCLKVGDFQGAFLSLYRRTLNLGQAD